MSRVIGAVIGAVTAMVIASCGGETADSYCGEFYREGGGGTPIWAKKDDLFSDRRSCVEWYDDQAGQVQ